MQATTEAEFKTLLTKEEYDRLCEKFKGNRIDYQTNHYFDTSRFSLKASDASLRVRERDTLELTFRKKKSYSVSQFDLPLKREQFTEILETGHLPEGQLADECSQIVGDQKLVNYMSLSTKRLVLHYGKGILFIDESQYLGITDYELEYEARNYYDGKKEFIQLIQELNVKYKRSEKKIQRAFNAFKNMR